MSKFTALWARIWRRYNSKQLQLLTPSRRDRAVGILLEFLAFLQALAAYLVGLPASGVFKLLKLLKSLKLLISALKFRLIGSLIWSRGRLGRPVIHFGVLGLAGAVFMTGGTMQSNFVTPQVLAADLVLGVTDMTPEQNTAKTTAPDYRQREAEVEYIVASGDTLSSIGAKFNVSVESLQYANNYTGNVYLKPGQKLIVPPMSGLLVTVAGGDTITGLAAKYSVSPQAIVDINYLDEPFTLRVGQKLMVPGGKVPPKPVYVATPEPAIQNGLPLARGDEPIYSESFAYSYRGGEAQTVGTGDFRWPTSHRYITQYFSYYHPALDIAQDSDIYAADTGTVVRSGWWPNGFGNAVQIDHGNGYSTIYGHMSVLSVSVGEIVEKGQVLGHMGNTGRSFGQHVHFVVQKNGAAVNPLTFF